MDACTLTRTPRRRWPGWIGQGMALVVGLAALAAGATRAPLFPALDLGFDSLDAGELLLGELNCTACHTASERLTTRLQPHPPPELAAVATRLQPAHVRAWIRDPLATKPGTTMPDVLRRLPEAARDEAATDLTHFLFSLPSAEPFPPATRSGPLQVQQGRVLYHQVGCVACHAPMEAAAAVFSGTSGAPTDTEALRYTLNRLQETSQPLPDLAAKYRPGALARFLADPLTARPGGRMPSLSLTEAEARALAAYLIQVTAQPGPEAAAGGFVPDPVRVQRGREHYAALGCAACHAITVAGKSLASTLPARPLAALDAGSPAGCLSPGPAGMAPRWVLTPVQRDALRGALTNGVQEGPPDSPLRRVTLKLAAYNCVACHSRDGLGGPGPSRWDYFTTLSNADLGDEGRIPPHLGAVGNKLRPAWLGQVLTNRGSVRPYLAVRMPQYGAAAVGGVVADLVAADATPEARKPLTAGDAEAGRGLVGLGGYSCITCHRFGPHPSLGISVMDMTQMAPRLEWDWFRHYLLDPPSLRPGTRMPAFWPEGKATVPGLLDGDTERQVAAIWAFLEQGDRAAPPPGLLENAVRPSSAPAPDYE